MKKILCFIYLFIATVACFAQGILIGGPNKTAEVLGGLTIDSAALLPWYTPFLNKGMGTTGRIAKSTTDSLPVYMKAGIVKKVLTKWDSATVYVDAGEVGNANGVASLNSSGIVPSAQLPAITISGQVYIDASQGAMLGHAGATAGALSVRVDSSSELFVLTTTPSSVRANWHITQGNGVSAFNGQTGAINPLSGDYITDSVREGVNNLYYTTARVQSVVASDTAAGWVVSGARLGDSTAAIRSSVGGALGLNQVLINNPNTNRGINIGKTQGAFPYGESKLFLAADSSGIFQLWDTTHVYRIQGTTSFGVSDFFVSGGSGNVDISASPGSAEVSINDGVHICTVGPQAISFIGGNLSSLDINSGLTANQIHGDGATPSISAGTGAGTSPTISITGTDVGGFFNIATGTSPTAANTIVAITFARSFSFAPRNITITPANPLTSNLYTTGFPYVLQSSITTTGFSLTSISALTGGKNYQFYYSIIQ